MNVAPKTVSARVVYTRIAAHSSVGPSIRRSAGPTTGKTSSAPSLRPSQFRCVVVVLSDQSIFDLSSRSASSRSA